MASQAFLLLGFLPLVNLLLPLASAASIQDLLRANGLPPGLLPRSVESFSLDPSSGLLEVRLDYPCYARFESLVFFDRVVRGNLSYGSLHGVVGVSQEELFLWLPVREIVVTDPSSGVIFFDIGVAHKQLSLSLFEYPPKCQPGKQTELAPLGEGEIASKMRSLILYDPFLVLCLWFVIEYSGNPKRFLGSGRRS